MELIKTVSATNYKQNKNKAETIAKYFYNQL